MLNQVLKIYGIQNKSKEHDSVEKPQIGVDLREHYKDYCLFFLLFIQNSSLSFFVDHFFRNPNIFSDFFMSCLASNFSTSLRYLQIQLFYEIWTGIPSGFKFLWRKLISSAAPLFLFTAIPNTTLEPRVLYPFSIPVLIPTSASFALRRLQVTVAQFCQEHDQIADLLDGVEKAHILGLC